MFTSSSRVRPSALALVGTLSVALLTGCGSASDKQADASAGASRAASPSPSAAPEVRALSQKKLTTLALADGEAPMYKVQGPPAGQLFDGDWDDVKVREECKPLVQVSAMAPVGDAKTHVVRTIAEVPDVEPAADGGLPDLSVKDMMEAIDVTAVTLATYSGDGAERAMKNMTDAVEKCAKSFSYSMPGQGQALIQGVEVEKDAQADGSDETIAFAVASEQIKKGAPPAVLHCQVVRHGNNVVSYVTMNVAKLLNGKPYKLDAAVVAFQSKKVTERLGML